MAVRLPAVRSAPGLCRHIRIKDHLFAPAAEKGFDREGREGMSGRRDRSDAGDSVHHAGFLIPPLPGHTAPAVS